MAATAILNFSIEDFILNNYEKIKTITPINPSISEDDEWFEEDIWDTFYKELVK